MARRTAAGKAETHAAKLFLEHGSGVGIGDVMFLPGGDSRETVVPAKPKVCRKHADGVSVRATSQ